MIRAVLREVWPQLKRKLPRLILVLAVMLLLVILLLCLWAVSLYAWFRFTFGSW